SLSTLEVIFLVDVGTAAIAIFVLMAFLPIPLHAKASERQDTSYLADMIQGLKYVKQHAFLKSLFLFFAIFFVLMAPAAFLPPLQVTRTFGDEVWRLTAIEIAFSIGMMAGGGLIAAWGGFRNRIHTMTLASLIMGGCTLALGIVPSFWVYLLFMALFGIAMPI